MHAPCETQDFTVARISTRTTDMPALHATPATPTVALKNLRSLQVPSKMTMFVSTAER